MGVAKESSLKLEKGVPYLLNGLFRVERHETTVRHDRGLRRARSYKRSTDRHLRKYRSERGIWRFANLLESIQKGHKVVLVLLREIETESNVIKTDDVRKRLS